MDIGRHSLLILPIPIQRTLTLNRIFLTKLETNMLSIWLILQLEVMQIFLDLAKA